METIHMNPIIQQQEVQIKSMKRLLFSKLMKPTTITTTKILSFTNNHHHLKPFCTLRPPPPPRITTTSNKTKPKETNIAVSNKTKTTKSSGVGGCGVRVSKAIPLNECWVESLTAPIPSTTTAAADSIDGDEEISSDGSGSGSGSGSGWVIGIDPDVSGALAVLKVDDSSVSGAQVFDSPHLKVVVGRTIRKRLDAKSIIQLLRSLDAPAGTMAYIEKSLPFPKDGKQGWWSSGFCYGLWIGILVAFGFRVIPVPSFTWKKEFLLTGSGSNKDDSRSVASTLFPSLSTSLKRKKDHGRAEALLIAAYGKSLNVKSTSSCVLPDMEKPL